MLMSLGELGKKIYMNELSPDVSKDLNSGFPFSKGRSG
ncbi:hypothetical protein SLEP1_g43837 [Rubroshorea leprosula]|uniref:Uncharacterized protein n=1 Tax=Rubroshorea leprosula TaxID=152421 RepID=A0AAV5LFB3_9ROSI|nr:hypothetical protein SLEP1_g43837 [Rubroshorea leprosula]